MPFLLHVLESILLVASLSTDAFAASIAYGAGKIRVPAGSVLVISAVCSAMLGASLLAGSFVSRFLPPGVTRWLCFGLLLAIGLLRLCDNFLKNQIRRRRRVDLHFSASQLHFVLTIYADAKAADLDGSQHLSVREAAALAVALSLDGLTVGFGAAVAGTGIWTPILASLLLTALAVKGGCALGARLSRLPFDLSYLSGLLLIVLAVLRL